MPRECAILHGEAIAAYFVHLRQQYCNSTMLNVPHDTLYKLGSEERLGLMLSAHSVSMHDVRWVSSAMSPQLQRTKHCTTSNHNVMALNSRSISNPLPTGPWDQRRQRVCRQQRRLPSSNRTRCLPVDGVYDDIQYGHDVERMLH